MITSIEIENLRGIRTGKLEGLTPLTILTGPNACGKSTVLDALLIATSPTPDAVGHAVQRHPGVRDGAKWLFGASGRTARLEVGASSGIRWNRELVWAEGNQKPAVTLTHRQTHGSDGKARDGTRVFMSFSADNQYSTSHDGRDERLSDGVYVQLVDPGLPPVALHRTFTEMSRTVGRRDAVDELLSKLIPAYQQLEILVSSDDIPSLHLRSAGRSVPVGLAGDGIQAFIQLALEIAVAPEGLVLLEEPEVYQHPRAIWQSAKVVLINMRRGVQTVLTTHSLELIDALLAGASPDDLEKMSVFNLLLEDGKLSSGRRAGEEIAFARQTLEDDLR